MRAATCQGRGAGVSAGGTGRIMAYGMPAVPEWRLEAGIAAGIAAHATRLATAPHDAAEKTGALVVADPFWLAEGLAGRLAEEIGAAGVPVSVLPGPAGEPGLADLEAAVAAARGGTIAPAARLVIGIGGGSTLDVAKAAAAIAPGPAMASAVIGGAPLPHRPLAKIMVPTTAGTGSEFSATNIVTLPSGRKGWVWGAATKPDLVLMDPALTASLPPALTGWCGMDAFIHAFEACTCRHAHDGVEPVAHAALALAARALPRAVAEGGDLEARAAMLMASGLAGQAIDACGTGLAHNLSHALAGIGAVNHGLATALAFEATLPWLVTTGAPRLDRAAAALGLRGAASLPGFVSRLMDASGIERRLPACFRGIAPERLAAEIRDPANAPMLAATPGDFSPRIEATAAALLALAAPDAA